MSEPVLFYGVDITDHEAAGCLRRLGALPREDDRVLLRAGGREGLACPPLLRLQPQMWARYGECCCNNMRVRLFAPLSESR